MILYIISICYIAKIQSTVVFNTIYFVVKQKLVLRSNAKYLYLMVIRNYSILKIDKN